MSKRSSVLAIVPARGGSKGIKHKNLCILGGVPLIVHTLRALANAELVTNHLVSTDDRDIAAVARKHGGQIPFLRSDILATDTASIIVLPLGQLVY